MKRSAIVIGGGIVGVCSALELQKTGNRVILIDRKKPGRETSYGNAGVLSESSVMVINNPSLLKSLPKYLFNNKNDLRYNFFFVINNLPKILRFLSYCTTRHMNHAGAALRSLLVLSLAKHKTWIKIAKIDRLLKSEGGWLKLFRSPKTYKKYKLELDLMKKLKVKFTIFEREQIRQIEPGLKPIYEKAVLMDETSRISDPAALTDAYVKMFLDAGGTVVKGSVSNLEKKGTQWSVKTSNEIFIADHVVLAAGGWSEEIAKWLGYKIPLFWERGYHMHLKPSDAPALNRTINDIDGGFIMAPMEQGVRITSGVEITSRDAKPNYTQIHECVRRAREVYEMKNEIDEIPWMGRRPTLIDSLPIIGPAPNHSGLWFNFGHQHLGLSMAPGSADLIASFINNKSPEIDPSPFSAARFKM